MNKKGFTLIELLSVVILLTLLVFLVLPNITNMVKNYGKETDEVVLKMIKDAAKLYREENKDNITNDNYCVSINELVNNNYLKGNIEYKDYIINHTMSVLITYDGGYNYDLVKNKYCNKLENGTPIYFDVAKGEGCSQKEYEKSYDQEANDYLNSKTGYNGFKNKKAANDTTLIDKLSTQNSCLKFYIYNDDGGDSVNLLLDHNTTFSVAWNSSESNATGPKELLTQLKTDTDAWVGTKVPTNYTMESSISKYTIDYSKYKARLITAEEITQITGNTTFDVLTTEDGFYYFDTNSTTESDTCKYNGNISGCKYGWLYDRIYTDCTKAGCLNNSDVEKSIYWTASSSAMRSDFAFRVLSMALEIGLVNFYLSDDTIDIMSSHGGVRPVIEVLKSKLN